MTDKDGSFAQQVAERVRPHLTAALGSEPAPDLAERLGDFAEALLRANAVLNLTGITDIEGMARRHLIDSLVACRVLRDDGLLLDLGSGGGVPGIPLALALPSRRVVLVESRERKAAALAGLVDELDLAPRVTAVRARAEQWLADHAVDTVVVRAVGEVDALLRLLAPVRQAFRRLVLLKGPGVDAELATAARRLERWGGALERHDVTLPGGDERRTLLVLPGGAAAAGVSPRA